MGVRAITSLNDGRTAVDHQKEQSGVGALAVDYQGERFRAWAYFLAQTDRFNAPARPFFMRAGVPVPKAADGRRNVTQPWEYSDVDDRGGLLRMEYDVTDGITVFGNAGASHSNVERFFASAPTITSVLGRPAPRRNSTAWALTAKPSKVASRRSSRRASFVTT
jgi:iron complex outermembrane receptor protein